MTKYYFTLFLGLCTSTISVGQDIISELYNYNYSFVNPAFAGANHQVGFLLNHYRYNNSGFIRSGVLFYEAPIQKINSAAGLIAYGETIGPSSTSSYGGIFNHQFFSKRKIQLKFGAKIYYQKISIDFSDYHVADPGDPLISNNSYAKSTAIMADLGTVVKFKEGYASLSVNNIFDARPLSDFGVVSYSSKTERVIHMVFGIDHKFSDKLSSSHSIYSAIRQGELKFVDLNNSITAFNWLLLGVGLHISDKSALRISSGFKIKNDVDLQLLVYSNDYEDRGDSTTKVETMLTIKL